MIDFRKPSTCHCGPGGFRLNGSRWVVVERRELPKTSQLKCLECGWKWWSKCRYVKRLSDHVERSFSGMTDADILDRINGGSLSVDLHTAIVVSHKRNKRLKVIERESNKSTYRFVEVCHKGKKKKIALHRLVWMAANRQLVPDGFDVDHIEADKRDSIDNLRLLDSSTNRRRGKPETYQDEELPF